MVDNICFTLGEIYRVNINIFYAMNENKMVTIDIKGRLWIVYFEVTSLKSSYGTKAVDNVEVCFIKINHRRRVV